MSQDSTSTFPSESSLAGPDSLSSSPANLSFVSDDSFDDGSDEEGKEASLVLAVQQAQIDCEARIAMMVKQRTRELQCQLDHDLDELVILRREKSELKGSVQKLSQDLATARSDIEDATCQIGNLENQVADLQGEVRAGLGRETEAEHRMAEQETRISQLERDLEQSRESESGLLQDLSRVTETLHTTEENLSEAVLRADDDHTRIHQLRNDNEYLETQFQDLSDSHDSLTSTCSDLRLDRSSLQEELETVKKTSRAQLQLAWEETRSVSESARIAMQCRVRQEELRTFERHERARERENLIESRRGASRVARAIQSRHVRAEMTRRREEETLLRQTQFQVELACVREEALTSQSLLAQDMEESLTRERETTRKVELRLEEAQAESRAARDVLERRVADLSRELEVSGRRRRKCF